MSERDNDNLLRSWKDISAHLGCDVRTCHRWEKKFGMPVHRADAGESKSHVFAYKDDLDRWFRMTFKSSSGGGQDGKDGIAGKGGRPLRWAAAAAVALALVAAAVYELPRLLAKRQPADFSIEGSALIVRDKAKRELWRVDTGMEDLVGESYYRANFQVMDHSQGNILPALVIKDIDNDGDTEVLFAPKRVTDQTGEGRLHCYDRQGAERWSFRAGKELRGGGKVYSPDYRIAGFHTHDLDGDGTREVVVEAFHAPDWPCQLAVLDCRGKLVGEYWNAGYLRDVAYRDLDGDGREEIIVAGVNNEYRGGCLIVLDPRAIGGASPQSGEFVCEGLGPGTELAYVTVPRTDVSEAMGSYVCDLRTIDITENRRIRATSSIGLIYEFGFDLAPLQVYWGHTYIFNHQKMAEAGKLASVLDDAYARNVLEGVRWWDGSSWSAAPARNGR